MWNIIFVVIASLAASGIFENVSIGWEIAIFIISIIAEIMILRNEYRQEKQQDRIEALEKRLKESLGDKYV